MLNFDYLYDTIENLIEDMAEMTTNQHYFDEIIIADEIFTEIVETVNVEGEEGVSEYLLYILQDMIDLRKDIIKDINASHVE